MKIISFLGLFLLASLGYSQNESILKTCKPVKVADETVFLSAKKPLIMMIHNLSNTDLWITHPVSEPSASAGWSSRIQAGKWSALALDKDNFELSCIESRPGHEQQVPCHSVISVCRWSKVTMPSQAENTYWAGENMKLASLLEHLGGKGFELPFHPKQ